MKIQSYKDLEVWQIAVELVDMIFAQTENFPQREIYGLAREIRRSAISVPSNIAEGSGRAGTKELIQFLYIARGSLCELDTQYYIASRRGFIQDKAMQQAVTDKISSISKMLSRLVQSLQRKN